MSVTVSDSVTVCTQQNAVLLSVLANVICNVHKLEIIMSIVGELHVTCTLPLDVMSLGLSEFVESCLPTFGAACRVLGDMDVMSQVTYVLDDMS